METKGAKDLDSIILQGLQIAADKVIAEAKKNNKPVVVSIDGTIKYIYPALEEEKLKK